MTNLIPYRKNNKWGFSNSDKKIVIKCDYDDISIPFMQENFNLALVKKDNKTAWIDEKGNEISPFADFTHQFTHDGISVIVLNKEIELVKKYPNCLFINPNGETLFDNDFLTTNNYQNSLCIAMNKNRKYGCINEKGEIVHAFKYEDYNEIWELIGRPYFYDKRHLEKERKVYLKKFENENRYIGFKDPTEKIIIPAKYYLASEFYEGVSAVAIKEKEFFFINEQGEKIIDNVYYYCDNFNNGIAKVVTNKINADPHVHSRWNVDYYIPDTAKWGYIDKLGNEYWED